jgi:hypothetical protein
MACSPVKSPRGDHGADGLHDRIEEARLRFPLDAP